jgi:hypothetical protein
MWRSSAMSGPIVRKYGFPNFDQIFGKKELEHGVEGKDPVDPLHREKEEKAGNEKPGDGEKPAKS